MTIIYRRHRWPRRISIGLSGDELVGISRRIDARARFGGRIPWRRADSHVHNGYLASCGLNLPRLDSVPRTIDFAIEMQRIIERFNSVMAITSAFESASIRAT